MSRAADPVWYQAASPLGSAVHYIASLSPKFSWVGIYLVKGKTLELGPYIGAPKAQKRMPIGKGKSDLVIPILDRKGSVLGQIDIDSREHEAFKPDEEEAVRRVARELGERWPE